MDTFIASLLVCFVVYLLFCAFRRVFFSERKFQYFEKVAQQVFKCDIGLTSRNFLIFVGSSLLFLPFGGHVLIALSQLKNPKVSMDFLINFLIFMIPLSLLGILGTLPHYFFLKRLKKDTSPQFALEIYKFYWSYFAVGLTIILFIAYNIFKHFEREDDRARMRSTLARINSRLDSY